MLLFEHLYPARVLLFVRCPALVAAKVPLNVGEFQDFGFSVDGAVAEIAL
jgi:hypothetical protein